MPTSPMAPAPPVVVREPHMPPGPVRPQAIGQTTPSRSSSAAVQRAAGDAVWVPAGQLVRIGGCPISGGLIYVGRELAAVTGGGPDPALIDPGLGIDHQVADYTRANMGYWPSYSTIAPACRAAYLQWLADGRHAPQAYIGYVFLYFYGLERRLLVDAQQSAAARSEREMLATEVRRLIGIYGTNGSFRGYAEGLLAFVTADDAQRRYLSSPPPGGMAGRYRSSCGWGWGSSPLMPGRCLRTGRWPGCGCIPKDGCARQPRAARPNSTRCSRAGTTNDTARPAG